MWCITCATFSIRRFSPWRVPAASGKPAAAVPGAGGGRLRGRAARPLPKCDAASGHGDASEGLPQQAGGSGIARTPGLLAVFRPPAATTPEGRCDVFGGQSADAAGQGKPGGNQSARKAAGVGDAAGGGATSRRGSAVWRSARLAQASRNMAGRGTAGGYGAKGFL